MRRRPRAEFIAPRAVVIEFGPNRLRYLSVVACLVSRSLIVLVVLFSAIEMAPPADAAVLVPAPGTGHGTLTALHLPRPPHRSSTVRDWVARARGLNPVSFTRSATATVGADAPKRVGLPACVCIGQFPSPGAGTVSITPPSGRTIVLPTQTLPVNRNLLLEVLVMPSPPRTRYRITNVMNGGFLRVERFGWPVTAAARTRVQRVNRQHDEDGVGSRSNRLQSHAY